MPLCCIVHDHLFTVALYCCCCCCCYWSPFKGTVSITAIGGTTNVNQPPAEIGYNHIPARWDALPSTLSSRKINKLKLKFKLSYVSFSPTKDIIKKNVYLEGRRRIHPELPPSTRSQIFPFTFTYFLKALAVCSESTAIMWLASQIRTPAHPPAWSVVRVRVVDEVCLPCINTLFCMRRLVNPPSFADVSLIKNVVVVGDRFDPGWRE